MSSGVCCTEVAFDIEQFGFTVSSLFSRDKQAAVGSLLLMEVILANTSPLLNTLRKKIISWSRTWSISWHLHSRIGKIAHIIEQPNIKISSLPRESSLNHSWPSWILPQAIRDIHLSCPWFLAERDYCSKSINISTCIHRHPGMPEYKKHNRLRMSSILHPTDFAFFWLL